MKIELQNPYAKDWKRGYIVINPEGRRTVILFNTCQDRSSVSYARYLMATHLKRYLDQHEHVDHIDNDKTNDVIENLQILTQAENSLKSAKGETLFSFMCPVCAKVFTLTARQSHKINPTCSKRCGGIKSHWKSE